MTRQTTNLPHLRGRSVGGSHKAWRGKSGWQDYIKAKGKLSKNKWRKTNLINPFKWSSVPTYVGLDHLIDKFTPYSGLLPSLFKKGGRVRGVGKAKRGFGRAMRKK